MYTSRSSRYSSRFDDGPSKSGLRTSSLPVTSCFSILSLSSISKMAGGRNKAEEEIGIGCSVLERMTHEKYLSVDSAKKILNCYNRMKDEKNSPVQT